MSKVPDVESIIKAAEDKLDDDSESIITLSLIHISRGW